MITGIQVWFEAGADEPLYEDLGKDFPIAGDQWLAVDKMLREARGLVVQKPEVVRPLWLVLSNTTKGTIPVVWVCYRIGLKSGMSTDSYSITANLPFEGVPSNGTSRIAMLNLDAWDFVKAEVTAVTTSPPTEFPVVEDMPESVLTHEQGPRDLRVVVYCPTGASFPHPAQVIFELPKEKAKIRFRPPAARETVCVTRHHELPGLIAVIDLPQRTGDLLGHAFHATALCDGVVSTAFALTLADMRESFPVLAIDATPGLKDRPFINFFADQVVIGRRAHLDPVDWSEKATGMVEKASKRVARAIRWLRKMHTEDDVLDRFLAGWTGLETLNPELCKHFGVDPSADDVRECECGKKLVRKVPRANGLKELFVREDKRDVYEACSKSRNGLVHGFENIAEVTAVAREHTSNVGLMLAKGIRILSGIPVPTDPDKFIWLNGFRVASLLFFEGMMNCGEVDSYEKSHNEMPLCEFAVRHEGGVVEAKTVLRGKTNIGTPPGCTITAKSMGVSGPAKITELRMSDPKISLAMGESAVATEKPK